MKIKLLFAMLILALVGIGSCSKPQEAIESPYNPVSQVQPVKKSRTYCSTCKYETDCVESPSIYVCPNCHTDMEIILCQGGK
jgi:predicted RNA-binding Zn-ribbon protein involved in translation (DUF1610 family)